MFGLDSLSHSRGGSGVFLNFADCVGVWPFPVLLWTFTRARGGPTLLGMFVWRLVGWDLAFGRRVSPRSDSCCFAVLRCAWPRFAAPRRVSPCLAALGRAFHYFLSLGRGRQRSSRVLGSHLLRCSRSLPCAFLYFAHCVGVWPFRVLLWIFSRARGGATLLGMSCLATCRLV